MTTATAQHTHAHTPRQPTRAGFKPTYGFQSGDAQLLGAQRGEEVDLRLSGKEHIKAVEVKEGPSCIEYVKVVTSTGRELPIGRWSAGTRYLSAPQDGAFVYGIKGSANGERLCDLQLTWATDSCVHPTPVSCKGGVRVRVRVPPPLLAARCGCIMHT